MWTWKEGGSELCGPGAWAYAIGGSSVGSDCVEYLLLVIDSCWAPRPCAVSPPPPFVPIRGQKEGKARPKGVDRHFIRLEECERVHTNMAGDQRTAKGLTFGGHDHDLEDRRAALIEGCVRMVRAW